MSLFDVTERDVFDMLSASRSNTTNESRIIFGSIQKPIDEILTRWLVNDRFEFLSNLPCKELLGLAVIGMAHNDGRKSFKTDVMVGFSHVKNLTNSKEFSTLLSDLRNSYDFDSFNYVKPETTSEIAMNIGFDYQNNRQLSLVNQVVTVLKYGVKPNDDGKHVTHLMPVEKAIDTIIDLETKKVTYKFKNKPDVVMEY